MTLASSWVEKGVAALHDVEVRDDVALVVPHETRALALRDGELVEIGVLPDGDVGDEHDGGRGLLEHPDGVLLVGQQRGGGGRQGEQDGERLHEGYPSSLGRAPPPAAG
jgi:hypothetical protein